MSYSRYVPSGYYYPRPPMAPVPKRRRPRAPPQPNRRRKPASSRRPRNNTPADERPKSASGIVRTLGSLGGTALGGYLGGPPGAALGSAIGSKAGDLFSSITGMGDYTVSYNTIVNADQTPVFRNKGRSVFVSHREYIQDVITSPTATAFRITSFDLNPAEPKTYPWLATIAQNFEEYRIHGMVFHYKSNSADALNSVNTALGTVVMATQYNILLDEFRNKQEMENYEFGCSSRPSVDLLHPVECDPKVTSFGPIFDIKLGGNDKGDPRLYTPGRFSIATVGQQGTSVNIGELWVTYEIEFFKPRMGDVASQINQWRIVDTFTSSAPFGTPPSAVISESSDFNACRLDPLNRQIVFDSSYTGIVQITVIWRATSAAGTSTQSPTISVSASGSIFRTLYGDLGTFSSVAATNQIQLIHTCYVTMVNGCTVTYSDTGVFTNMVACDIVVTTLPNTFRLYEEEDDDDFSLLP